MFSLLKEVKKYLNNKYSPSGYTLGWNVVTVSGQITPFHVHLHIMSRYDDAPLAAKGIRHFLEQKKKPLAVGGTARGFSKIYSVGESLTS